MNKAFTLIELLVIVGIVSMFTAILFVDYGSSNKALALDRASQKMSQDIRRAQEMAMSGVVGDASTNGYGVYFDKAVNYTQYIIYRNDNSNMYYEPGVDSVSETINIEAGIKICDIKDNATSVNNISTSFQPPDPINYINSNYTGHEASIVLCIISDPSKTRTVKVNNTGRVDITNP